MNDNKVVCRVRSTHQMLTNTTKHLFHQWCLVTNTNIVAVQKTGVSTRFSQH